MLSRWDPDFPTMRNTVSQSDMSLSSDCFETSVSFSAVIVAIQSGTGQTGPPKKRGWLGLTNECPRSKWSFNCWVPVVKFWDRGKLKNYTHLDVGKAQRGDMLWFFVCSCGWPWPVETWWNHHMISNPIPMFLWSLMPLHFCRILIAGQDDYPDPSVCTYCRWLPRCKIARTFCACLISPSVQTLCAFKF